MVQRRTLVLALLGASLALNLALGAMLAWPARPQRGFERLLARLESVLPAADRAAFHAVVEAERAHYAGALATLRSAGAEVDRAMRQEPHDPAALRAAMAQWSAAWADFNAAFSETLVRALGQVSPAGRAAIADARRHSP